MKKILPGSMRATPALVLILLTLVHVLVPSPVRGADPELVPPRPSPDQRELRERGRLLSPQERQKLVQEFRERRGASGTNRTEWEKRREQFRSLPPAEREARLRELRQRQEQIHPNFRVLTPVEREAKRKQLKERVAGQIAVLREKKADGSITEIEQRRLQRMEEMVKRLDSGALLGPRRGLLREGSSDPAAGKDARPPAPGQTSLPAAPVK